DRVRTAGPQQGFKRIHRKLVIDHPPDGWRGAKHGCQHCPKAPCAQFPRKGGDKDDPRATRERRPEEERRQRGAEGMSCNPSDGWEQWGQIDIAEVEMLGAGKVIERVTKVAVARRRCQM